MRIEGIIWFDEIIEKLEWKHSVQPREVTEVLSTHTSFVSLKKGIAPERTYMPRWDKQMQGAILLFSLYIKKIGVHLSCQHGI